MDRRQFLTVAGAALLWPAGRGWAQEAAGAAEPAKAKAALAAPVRKALETSEFVYISPLRSDGKESTCHGEVWFGSFDDSAVIVTSTQSWKVRSLVRGLDRARVWVGDYGRWKRLVGRNESFRKAPSFDAKVEFVRDDDLLEALLERYDTKYPAEIGRWRQRMHDEYYAGTRVMLRYSPV